jgi:hypothetical protein
MYLIHKSVTSASSLTPHKRELFSSVTVWNGHYFTEHNQPIERGIYLHVPKDAVRDAFMSSGTNLGQENNFPKITFRDYSQGGKRWNRVLKWSTIAASHCTTNHLNSQPVTYLICAADKSLLSKLRQSLKSG